MHRFEVLEFSEIHFRIVGARTIDYWPSTNRYWVAGAPAAAKGTVAEIVDIAMTADPVPKAARHPKNRTGGPGYVYCGTVPPWDESLGDHRPFTEEEKAAGVVCVYRP